MTSNCPECNCQLKPVDCTQPGVWGMCVCDCKHGDRDTKYLMFTLAELNDQLTGW